MLPDASTGHMTLSDLQALAARQQVAMETQQQALVARETRLKYLQQREAGQQQLGSEEARLRGMKERVEEQELKLRRLLALRGQVEQHRAHNGHLTTELDAVRALFNQKEKELALAVSRVDALMKQLHDLREVRAKEVLAHGHGNRGNGKTLTLELERLKEEVVKRSQLNAGCTSRLAAQQQLLQQRRDKVAEADARIQELQQRLKKRRSQQSPPPPPPRQPLQQSSPLPSQTSRQPPQPHSGDRGGGRRWHGGEGARKQNVAAVEPYVQHLPKDMARNVSQRTEEEGQKSKGEFFKDPVSKSNAKIPSRLSDDLSTHHSGVPRPANVEENNNEHKSKDQEGQQAPEEYKIPSIITSHVDAQRGPARGRAGKEMVPVQKSGAEVMASSVTCESVPGAPSWHTQGPMWTSAKNPTCAIAQPSQPALNSFGKSSSLSKWPPPSGASREGVGEPSVSSPLQHPPHHPHINIFEEERQAGSGQSSPASSEGSGAPSVNHGPGLSQHHSPPTSSPGQPTVGVTTSAVMQTLPPEGHKHGVQSVSSSEPKRQAPKPPPRAPQTVLHSRTPAIPYSSPSTSFPSFSAPTSSLSTPFCSTSAAFSSADSLFCRASSSSQPVVVNSFSQPVVVSSLTDCTDQGVSRAGPRIQDPAQNSRIPSDSSPATDRGEDGKTGTAIHLNQRPAPTYRHASKNVITFTYTGRHGNSGVHSLQQKNRQQGSSASAETKEYRPAEGNTDSPDLGDNSSISTSDPQKSPTDGDRAVGLAHFGVVGAPSYPDIASDKGSYKSNTPKQVRRRHSDSDNEELAKVLKRGSKMELHMEKVTEDSANSSGNNAQPEPPSPSVPAADSNDSAPPSPAKPAPEKAGQKPASACVRQRKAILKGDKKGKVLKRVSFDSLALLLDASLEGELELVMRTAKEVEDVSQANDEGITALHNAICAGHYLVVKFLVEFGADVNSPDSDGWTPLHCAASCNNLPMVRVLVEHGACVLASTLSDHETPADKCEEDEDGYDHCSHYLYGVQEKLGIINKGVVYAVFDYSAIRPDELSFHVNDRLAVLRKGDEDEREWWWASGPDNKEGYIPRNLLGLYPRVLPPTISLQPLHSSQC